MLRHWPCKRDRTQIIVEYGPGTGSFSKRVLQNIQSEKFLAIELNPVFISKLTDRFPELDIYHGSAEKLGQALSDRQYEPANLVISGLPWAIFPELLQRTILEATIAGMDEDACFSTFAYLHALKLPQARSFKRLLGEYFQQVKVSKPIWGNIPPAVVYHCSQPRSQTKA